MRYGMSDILENIQASNFDDGEVKVVVNAKLILNTNNKPGTAQVGAISKAQNQQKDFQVFSSTVPENPKS